MTEPVPEETGGPFEEGLIDAHVIELPHELGPIQRFDDAVDRALDRFRGREPNDRIVYALSELADFSLLWHLVAWGRALRRTDERLPAAVHLTAALAVESFLVNGVIKSIFKRERPVVEAERPHKLRVPKTTSFPSGHSSSAMMAAVVLADHDRRAAPFWYALAGAVAVSRVYVRIHHASDVVGGAVTGLVLGVAARQTWRAYRRRR